MKTQHLTDVRFADLPLAEPVQKALKNAGFESCTAIQAKALPHLLKGKDIAGQAQTGTGKTMAFLTATFHYLLTHPAQEGRKENQPRAIIMAPTRELVVQIHKDAEALTAETGLKLGLVYGGEDYDKQRERLKEGCDILVGTMGRLIDYFKQGVYDLRAIQVVVMDEADRMFDLGFIRDIRFLLRRMPDAKSRLGMLFSATLSYRVQELAYEHMNNPKLVEVEPEQMTAKQIQEELFYPSDEDKMLLLLTLMEEEWPDRAIVFANTKYGAEEVWSHLDGDGHRVGLLTGDIPQKKRLKTLEGFTRGELDVLVATDVAARGLHIPDVTHVFNYDLPDDCEDYVHRIGRTGRAGASGHAISFACEKYALNLPAIEEYIRHAISVSRYDSGALLGDAGAPTPVQRRRSGGRGRPGSGRPGGGRPGGGRSGGGRGAGRSSSGGERGRSRSGQRRR